MRRVHGAILGTILLAAASAAAQTGITPVVPSAQQQQYPRDASGAGRNDSPFAAVNQQQIEKGRQSERQRKLIADTNRLLALANELKADMDKTTKDTLSIEVIRKAEEIEKLAHSVKERMKG